jgi:hypothetical protein
MLGAIELVCHDIDVANRYMSNATRSKQYAEVGKLLTSAQPHRYTYPLGMLVSIVGNTDYVCMACDSNHCICYGQDETEC